MLNFPKPFCNEYIFLNFFTLCLYVFSYYLSQCILCTMINCLRNILCFSYIIEVNLFKQNFYFSRYIEGLQAECHYISNWDSHLKATPETTHPPDPHRLPTHWLSNSVENHGSALNALWALRNYMLKDALNISRIS